MNKKQQKTLQAVFKNPVSGTILWSDIESLLVSVGAQKYEGEGSRVKFLLNNELLVTHKPHPGKEAKKYQVRDVRNFLNLIGVKP